MSNKRIVQLIVIVFASSWSTFAGAQAQYFTRPIPLGVLGSNQSFSTNSKGCEDEGGTLGALVADQSNNQYILGSAHVLALSPTGYFTSGSAVAIEQPDLAAFGLLCGQITSAIIAHYQVATLSTVVAPNFAAGSVSQSDTALAAILPGMVTSDIYFSPAFSGTPLAVYKKGIKVAKEGAGSGYSFGRTVSKMLIPGKAKLCTKIGPYNPLVKQSCPKAVVRFASTFEISPNNFATDGDSGSLVLTVGPCPQPVGVLVSKESSTGRTMALPIAGVLNALQAAGGYTSLSIVPGGGGCTPTVGEVATGSSSSLQDLTLPDPDVALALLALPDLNSSIGWMIVTGAIDGIGIDLSSNPAALDVVVESASDLDTYHIFVPATFEGVPVEQHVIKTYDLDLSAPGLIPN